MTTTDIWFTSYLKLKGFNVADYIIVGKNKMRFEFDITASEWKKLKLEFDSSDIAKIKQIQCSIKDLLY